MTETPETTADDAEPYLCAVCHQPVGRFLDHQGWQHYREVPDGHGGTRTELYDAADGHQATRDARQLTERPAASGELCTCGRQAVTVFITDQFGEVGYCGIEGSATRPVLPCPWCGTSEPHKAAWGDPARCPDYQLRPRAV